MQQTSFHVLILEDIPDVIEVLRAELARLEQELSQEVRVTVYSRQSDVERLVNPQPPGTYDAIILDRNAPDGSFHVLDIERFGPERIVSISSMPRFNREAERRGVQRVVPKSPAELKFAAKTIRNVQNILTKS